MIKLTYRIEGKDHISDQIDHADYSLSIKEEEGRRAVLLTAKRDLTLIAYEEGAPEPLASKRGDKRDLYFMNGYQSWTDTKERYLSEWENSLRKFPRLLVKHLLMKRFAFDCYGDYNFYRYRLHKLHGYDLFYVKGARTGFVLNLNYKRAYLVFEVQRWTREITLRSDVYGATLKAGESFPLIDYLYLPNYQEGIAEFRRRFPTRAIEKLFGYTSWYNYYQDINEEIILRDLDALDDRFNLFQIDDGYETCVGDWLDADE